MSYQEILDFWFEEVVHEERFSRSYHLDNKIKSMFGELLLKAKRGELFNWRETPSGRLAEIILLDQFSRNIYRGSPEAFAADSMALTLAQEMVRLKLDQSFELVKQTFIYMPYMHSESRVIHEEAVKLFSKPGMEESYRYEMLHKEIIDRFDRYPHRNQILGRVSTPDELEFLKTHSGF